MGECGKESICYEAIHENAVSVRDQRNARAADASVDDAHSLVSQHERANAIR